MAAPVPVVRVVRSGLEESVHLGHVAVCDARGRLVAWAGDPSHELYARSCMKPLQGAVSFGVIGPEERLPDRLVAVMCASHNGEPVHVGAVRALLKRAGLGPEALGCPPDYPIDPDSMARAHLRHRVLHNCSGKHAGMLLASVRGGWDPAAYLRRSHPLQRRILRAVLRATDRDGVHVGVDGCGVPVHGMRLRDVATIYARLASPERMGDLADPVERCVRAMLAEPYLVGGRGRSDTALMSETGDVLAKSGAEALECSAVRPSGLGVAVKIVDGGFRAAAPALLSVLRRLGAVDARQVDRLRRYSRPAVWGGGAIVGELRADVPLRTRR
ncbi:MAG TPA: asparaginase [Actinomycetota bacterium]|jgi:L-asparaginase II